MHGGVRRYMEESIVLYPQGNVHMEEYTHKGKLQIRKRDIQKGDTRGGRDITYGRKYSTHIGGAT